MEPETVQLPHSVYIKQEIDPAQELEIDPLASLPSTSSSSDNLVNITIKEEHSDSEESERNTETDSSLFMSNVIGLKKECDVTVKEEHIFQSSDNSEESYFMSDDIQVKCEIQSGTSSDRSDELSAHSNLDWHYPEAVISESNEQVDQVEAVQRNNGSKQPQNQPTCSVCHKSFADNGNLKRHMRKHTGQRPYICEICNKSFIWPGNLKNHMNSHWGERPYTCDICTKSFTRQGDLKTHKLTHTGLRSFKCEICNKSLTRSRDLKRHLLTHTGQRPYPCEICNKSFSQQGNLKRHLQNHKSEQS